MINTQEVKKDICPIVETIKLIGGKWELTIIRYLSDKPMRFNELLRNAEGISSRTLSRLLKNLMDNGIVKREVLSIQPVVIMYSLTQEGAEIKPVIAAIRDWGERNIKIRSKN